MKYIKKFELINNYNIWKNSDNYIAPNVSMIDDDSDDEAGIIDYNPLIIINPSVTMNGWTYGETASNPVISGNTGNGTVTYLYKVSSADDSTYTSTKPTDAGTYTIKANINAIRDYSAGSCTSTFTISKANINPSVTIEDWNEGDTASNPSVNGNLGNGIITYMYKVSSADDSTYTSTKPSNAGTYTVRATIWQTNNYNGATCTATFTINSSANPLIAKYNVTSTANATQLYYYGSSTSPFSSMEIDGIKMPVNVSYTFDTTGEHTVKFTLSNGITSISNYTFWNCSELTSIIIPDSITSIGDSAFYNCSGLTSITIPNSVTSIGQSAFGNCSELTSITIPNSVTSIGDSAFYSCSGLKNITIPNSVTSIGDNAFYGCSGLTSITIPDSVTSIGLAAFKCCYALTSIIIGNSVTSISSEAFNHCNKLEYININRSIAPSIQSDTFYNVKMNGILVVPSSNSGYDTWMSSSKNYLGYHLWEKITNNGNIGNQELTGLYWSKDSIYVSSNYYTLPTLTKPSGITVTYSSSNTDVATINSSTGAVTIKGTSTSNHDGSTYITALFNGNSTYRPKKVVYVLTVDRYTPPSSGGGGGSSSGGSE